MRTRQVCEMVTRELEQLKRLGQRVSKAALAMAQCEEEVAQYADDMTVGEIADLLREIY